MSARLYLGHSRYRAHLETAAEALSPYTGSSIIDLVVGGGQRIRQTGFAQPGLFAVEYALAATLIESGVRPDAVLGQGVGEFAAAVVAGALSLDDAALLVAARGAFMHFLPPGGMLAVRADARGPDDLHSSLSEVPAAEPAVFASAFNGPQEVVLSGEPVALDRVRAALRSRRIATLPVPVPHAFHSPLMAPVLGRYRRVLARTSPSAPRLPFYSTVRGRDLAGETLDAGYWTEHVTAPILLADAVNRLLTERRPAVIVEIGPRPSLTGLLRRITGSAGPACIAVCQDAHTDAASLNELLEALARGPARSAGGRWTTAAAA